jgi:hypothetical protein
MTDEGPSTINMLTDNVLLQIFYFYQDFYRLDPEVRDPRYRGPVMPLGEWCQLMHVCQRWRQIIFDSPCRLNLQILCTRKIRFQNSLDIWPDFPIAISYCSSFPMSLTDEDDVIAALEHVDRVICIEIMGSQLEELGTVLQKPFPVLTRLVILSGSESGDEIHGEELDLPDGFLGGSAPRLEDLTLFHMSLLALPTLLSLTKNLVKLNLYNVPPTGYISPDALVTCLAKFPRLDTLSLEFQSATARPGQLHPPPITRTILPALTQFHCSGANEYLEDLVAHIDCPKLEWINVSYFYPLVDFQVTQLAKFIRRSLTAGPNASPFRPTTIRLLNDSIIINMYSRTNPQNGGYDPAMTNISFKGTDRQVSHIAEVLKKSYAILSTVAYLTLISECGQIEATNDVDWLHLILPFSAVQTLHVSRELAGPLALALEGIPAEMVSDAFPSLRLISLEGQPTSSLKKFIAARRLSARPVIMVGETLVPDELIEYFADL